MSHNTPNSPKNAAGKASYALKAPEQSDIILSQANAQAKNQALTPNPASAKVTPLDKFQDPTYVKTPARKQAQAQALTKVESTLSLASVQSQPKAQTRNLTKIQPLTQTKAQPKTQTTTKSRAKSKANTKSQAQPRIKTLKTCKLGTNQDLCAINTTTTDRTSAQPADMPSAVTPNALSSSTLASINLKSGTSDLEVNSTHAISSSTPAQDTPDLNQRLIEPTQNSKYQSAQSTLATKHASVRDLGNTINSQVQVSSPAPQAVRSSETVRESYALSVTQQVLDALMLSEPVHLASFNSGFQTSSYTQSNLLDSQAHQLAFNTINPPIAAYELSQCGFNFESYNSNQKRQGTIFTDPNKPISHGLKPKLSSQTLSTGTLSHSPIDELSDESRMDNPENEDKSEYDDKKEDEVFAPYDGVDMNYDDANVHSDRDVAAAYAEALAKTEPQNPYTQEINRRALQIDLKRLPQDTKCNVIQEYFAIFTKAMNTIILNCNDREIVESGLETIINQAAPIFELEYKNFFYMCIHGAPKALFWMLQYPFFANFFLVKQRTLTLHLPRDLVITHKIIDEQIALEVSTTMENYAELKQRFALTNVPNINLQDNIMLSLYEEQILQKGLVKPLPQMTQRERIRKLVKLGGAFPVDPAKVRLRQVNHQIFSLHNLRVTELRNMSVALEKLAHAPRRLSRIFEKDFKHYLMPMQLIMKKMDTWVELYPVDQQCLLVQMDEGFFIRSPKDRLQVYTQDSFKEHPIIILDGLEVCYKTHEEPLKESEFIREYGDDSEYNYKGIAAFKELAAKMEATRERMSQHQRFDDHDLDSEYYNDLYSDDYDDEEEDYDNDASWGHPTTYYPGQTKPQLHQSKPQGAQAYKHQANFEDDASNDFDANTGFDEHANFDENDEFYRKAMARRHLQASDFEISHLDEFADDEVEDIAELEDNETFDFADEDAILGENNDQPAELFSTQRQNPGYAQAQVRQPGIKLGNKQNLTTGQAWRAQETAKAKPAAPAFQAGNTYSNGQSIPADKVDKAVKQGQSEPNKRPGNPSFISGVYFGSQGAANPAQLRLFNKRNLLVDELKVGFMIVTL